MIIHAALVNKNSQSIVTMPYQLKFHHVGEMELEDLGHTPEVGVQALVYS